MITDTEFAYLFTMDWAGAKPRIVDWVPVSALLRDSYVAEWAKCRLLDQEYLAHGHVVRAATKLINGVWQPSIMRGPFLIVTARPQRKDSMQTKLIKLSTASRTFFLKGAKSEPRLQDLMRNLRSRRPA